MFRLAKLNFKNAIFTAETLFGLGMEVLGGLFAGIMLAQSADKTFELSTMGYLPWIAGVFIAFALTIDNDSGAVRNRLIAGCSRFKILLSQVTAASLLSLVYMLVSLVPILIGCSELITKNKTAAQLLWGLLILTCGFILTAALAAVAATVIFSRTGAVIAFIALLLAFNGFAVKLFEEYAYDNTFYYVDGELVNDTGMPASVRSVLRAAACTSPLVQDYLYDEVANEKRRAYFEETEKDIAEYEAYAAAHPDFSDEKIYRRLQLGGPVNQLRKSLRIYREQEQDYYLLPLYSLGAVIIITAAGMLVYRKRNIE